MQGAVLPNRISDFEVWIAAPRQVGEDHRIEVFSSPAGPASGTLDLDPRAESFQTALAQVRSIDPDLPARQAFGRRLFDALFPAPVRRVWEASLGRLDGGELDGLRLRLRIDPPELAVLPWELLFDGTSFLATDARLVVSRYLPVREPAFFALPDRLRILVVVASPQGLPAIDPAEVDALTAALQGLGAGVELQVLRNEPLSGVHAALQQGLHVLHYLGHGTSRKLVLVDADGQSPRPIEDQELAQLVQGRRELRLVVLNACHSSQADQGGLFAGIGPALVQKSLPAVVAMQYPFVQLDTAGRFSRAFYGALANGKPVDLAVNEARQLLSAEGLADRDWSTPVLYMGTRSGRILGSIEKERAEAERAWRSVESAAREAGAMAALAELSQVFQDLDRRLRHLGGLTALAERLDQVDAAFDRCEKQARRPGGIIVPQLREEWNHVRRNEMTVLDAFLDGRPELPTPAWQAGLETEAAALDAALALVDLGQLPGRVAAFGRQLTRAREGVRLQIDRDLAELRALSDRTLGRFEIRAGGAP